jgi:hypothetical protein
MKRKYAWLPVLTALVLAVGIGSSASGQVTTQSFDTCGLGNGCIWSHTDYGRVNGVCCTGNRTIFNHTQCANWCGGYSGGGYPNGIASAVNAFTNRYFKIRVPGNGFVKCIPGAAPNLLNDGHGIYSEVKVGPNPSGC